MLKIGIYDNKKETSLEILDILKTYFKNNNIEACYNIFESCSQLLENCKAKNYNINILIIDLMIDNPQGISIAKEIKLHNPNTEIIFISDTASFAFDSFDANPFSYLIKPINEHKLVRELYKLVIRLNIQKNIKKYIEIKKNGLILFISINDIMYVTSNNRILTLHCKSENIDFYGKMNDFINKVNEIYQYEFIRCHKSYAVNPFYVKKIDKLKISLTDDTSIPISKLKYTSIKDQMIDYYKKSL